MNVVSFLINILAGLWLVPYLVDHIGTAAYGLIPLAMVFTEYISIITVSINSSITRFITIDIQKHDWLKANRTFNTAFFALCMLILLQIPILGYISFDIASLINVPSELLVDAFFLLVFTFSGYLISLMSSIFSTSMYANNRLDLTQTVDIARTVMRIITIVILFVFVRPSLQFVGIANLIGALSAFGISFFYWKKLTPKLRLSLSSFDKRILKQLLGMGGWLIVNQLGYLLFLKIDLIVINIFIGPQSGGEYAAVQQWNVLLRTLAGVLSGLIGPMLLISFARDNISNVIQFSKLGVKYLSLSIGLLTGLICGVSSQLLNVWLGPEFSGFSLLLIIMLCHLVINLGVLPLFTINTALNKVKIPGILTLVMGFLNLLLAIIAVKYLHLGVVGVAIAGLIVLTLKNGLFTPWYAARILKENIWTFFKPLIAGIALFILSFSVSFFFKSRVTLSDWSQLFLYMAAITFALSLFAWFLILTRTDRKMLISILPKVHNPKQ